MLATEAGAYSSAVINLDGELERCSLLGDMCTAVLGQFPYIFMSKYWINSYRMISGGLKTVYVSYDDASRTEHDMFWGSYCHYPALPPAFTS